MTVWVESPPVQLSVSGDPRLMVLGGLVQLMAGDRGTVMENFPTSLPPGPEMVNGPPSRNGGGKVEPDRMPPSRAMEALPGLDSAKAPLAPPAPPVTVNGVPASRAAATVGSRLDPPSPITELRSSALFEEAHVPGGGRLVMGL